MIGEDSERGVDGFGGGDVREVLGMVERLYRRRRKWRRGG